MGSKLEKILFGTGLILASGGIAAVHHSRAIYDMDNQKPSVISSGYYLLGLASTLSSVVFLLASSISRDSRAHHEMDESRPNYSRQEEA